MSGRGARTVAALVVLAVVLIPPNREPPTVTRAESDLVTSTAISPHPAIATPHAVVMSAPLLVEP